MTESTYCYPCMYYFKTENFAINGKNTPKLQKGEKVMWVKQGKTKLPDCTTKSEIAIVNILEIYHDNTASFYFNPLVTLRGNR